MLFLIMLGIVGFAIDAPMVYWICFGIYGICELINVICVLLED